jgi:hypothetical protein
MVGLSRFELLTPRLSSVCSNQLSYRPFLMLYSSPNQRTADPVLSKLDRTCAHSREYQIDLFKKLPASRFRLPALLLEAGDWKLAAVSRKEVIQPQVLLQLPCYDFTPITDHTLGTCLPCGLARLLLVQPAFVM